MAFENADEATLAIREKLKEKEQGEENLLDEFLVEESQEVNCLVPNSNGVQFRYLLLSTLWDKYYINGLEPRRQYGKRFKSQKGVS